MLTQPKLEEDLFELKIMLFAVTEIELKLKLVYLKWILKIVFIYCSKISLPCNILIEFYLS